MCLYDDFAHTLKRYLRSIKIFILYENLFLFFSLFKINVKFMKQQIDVPQMLHHNDIVIYD